MMHAVLLCSLRRNGERLALGHILLSHELSARFDLVLGVHIGDALGGSVLVLRSHQDGSKVRLTRNHHGGTARGLDLVLNPLVGVSDD